MTFITRRHFLKQTALAGLAASGLTATQLFAANTTPKRRVIFVYFPDGAESAQWHAKGNGKQFTLPAMTTPLQRVKEHCVFLNGINMVGSGGTHEGGIIKLLTGRSGQGNDLGISLDYYLGQLYKNETVTPLLNLNVVPIYTDKHITYDSNGIAVVPQMNPLAAFDSLFGAVNSNQAHQRQQVSILDHSLAELKALQKALGSYEKAKLDTHLDAVRQLERKLTAQGPGTCGAWDFNSTGFKVTHTELWQNPEFMDAKQMALIGDLHTDVAIHALSCGLTRVVTLKWNNSVNENVMSEAGSTMTCHGASHAGGAEWIKIKAWYAERFARLIEQLRDTPDGDGSLLDNTLVFLGSCLADGALHNHDNMPFILAGGSAGGIKNGVCLNFDGLPHNKLLVSIAQFMGANINQFGTQDSEPGALNQLLA